jgi:hypothetical protein
LEIYEREEEIQGFSGIGGLGIAGLRANFG